MKYAFKILLKDMDFYLSWRIFKIRAEQECRGEIVPCLSYQEQGRTVTYCGNIYEGPLVGGKRAGYGRLYSGGTFYEGGFKDGKFHGYGEMVLEDGFVMKGVWVEGLLNFDIDAEIPSEIPKKNIKQARSNSPIRAQADKDSVLKMAAFPVKKPNAKGSLASVALVSSRPVWLPARRPLAFGLARTAALGRQPANYLRFSWLACQSRIAPARHLTILRQLFK